MAERVPDDLVKHLAISGRTTYDWDKWSDGDWWHLKQGKDFDVKPASVRASANSWAEKYGYQLTTRTTEEGLLIRFTK